MPTASGAAPTTLTADAATDHTTVAATLLDRLDMDEISLVPRGGNQRADIVAMKAANGSATKAAEGFLGGLRRAMRAVLAKAAPDAASAAEALSDVDAGLEEAASAMLTLDVGTDDPAPAPAVSSPTTTEPTMDQNTNGAASTPAAGAPAAGAPAAGAPAEAAKHDTPTMTPDTIAKAIEDAVAKATGTLVAKLDEQAAVIAKLQAEQQDAATRAAFDGVFAGTSVAKAERDALYSVYAKADEAGRKGIEALATANKAALELAAVTSTVGKMARTHTAEAGTAHGEMDAIAKALSEKEGISYAEAYSKSCETNPRLAQRVLDEERAASTGQR